MSWISGFHTSGSRVYRRSGLFPSTPSPGTIPRGPAIGCERGYFYVQPTYLRWSILSATFDLRGVGTNRMYYVRNMFAQLSSYDTGVRGTLKTGVSPGGT